MTPEDLEAANTEQDQFVKSTYSLINAFAQDLGIEPSHAVLIDPVHMQELINRAQVFLEERSKSGEVPSTELALTVGCVMGEYFSQNYQGFWKANDNPESVQNGRYVLFAQSPSVEGRYYPIDVFDAAHDVVFQPWDGGIVGMIQELESYIE